MLILIIMAYPVMADSLWDPESPGLLSGSGDLQVGDIVLISIDLATELSYSSSRIDSERVSIELSGGEGAELFSFLPSGSSAGNQSLSGSDAVSISATFAARIVGIDENDQLVLQGGRTIAIQGKEESITITGVADPALVAEDRTLPFSSIADARLTYTTLLETGRGVIGPGDIVRSVPEAAAPDATESGVAPIAPSAPMVSLSDEKRQELMLIYVNRLIDLIFE